MKIGHICVALLVLGVSCAGSVESGGEGQFSESAAQATTTVQSQDSASKDVEKSALSAATVQPSQSVERFEVTVVAPASVNSYSEFEVLVQSGEEIADFTVISDRLIVLSSTNGSATILSPIVQQGETIDFFVEATSIDGQSARVSHEIEVLLYEHEVERFRHLNPADLQGTVSDDYAVFNFGFETIFVNERYSDTYCYPTVDNCNEQDGSFTADAHLSLIHI